MKETIWYFYQLVKLIYWIAPQLRKEFAKHANDFYGWLTETRALMMEGQGSLEEQLAAIGLKAHEVVNRGSSLKQIEDLGAILEDHLILDNRWMKVASVLYEIESRIFTVVKNIKMVCYLFTTAYTDRVRLNNQPVKILQVILPSTFCCKH